jgi:hypothetical protein
MGERGKAYRILVAIPLGKQPLEEKKKLGLRDIC